MINDPYDHNKTPNSSRIKQPKFVDRMKAIKENPVNLSVVLQVPLEYRPLAWKRIIETTPTSVEMNQIQYQYEFNPEALESTSTNTNVHYILPTTHQNPTLLRALLDTQVQDPKERKKQRERWKKYQQRHHANYPPSEQRPRAEDPDVDSLIDAISLNPPR